MAVVSSLGDLEDLGLKKIRETGRPWFSVGAKKKGL